MSLNYKTVEKSKNADWVVFFHGIGGNYSIFYKQMKAFRSSHNLLLIDFPGHGESASCSGKDYLKITSEKIVALMDKLHISSAHFVGISLGTLVMQMIAVEHPHRIKSMVLGGAVYKGLWWGELLGRVTLSFPLRHMLPYMIPYKTFAFILLPRANHKRSRELFIREAVKLGTNDYHRWALSGLKGANVYQKLKKIENTIPKLYLTGAEDHMFIDGIKQFVKDEKAAELHIIPKCGHVCNVECPEEFNEKALAFMKEAAAEKVEAVEEVG